MSKRADRPQTSRHIPIFDEDWEFMNLHYGPDSPSRVGPGPAIRSILHKWVEAQRAEYERRLEKGNVAQ